MRTFHPDLWVVRDTAASHSIYYEVVDIPSSTTAGCSESMASQGPAQIFYYRSTGFNIPLSSFTSLLLNLK